MRNEILAHYRICSKIGEGQFATVHRGYDLRLNRPVAIKILKKSDELGSAGWGQLLREARIVSTLSHPSICNIFDVGEDHGRNFVVFEFVEGRNLRATLASGPLPTRTSLLVGLAISGALEHAHSAGVLHRDLTPSNVMVTPLGTTKVIDFGLARALRGSKAGALSNCKSSVEKAAYLTGTLAYTAPEILHGEAASVQSDIWSLGVVLYEMLTGTLPFCGRTPFEVAAEVMIGRIKPFSAQLPPSVGAIVRRCLATNRRVRYLSAGEVCLHIREEIMSMHASPYRSNGRASSLLSFISTRFSTGGSRK